ncbi:hypothetical protein EB73_05700 [Mycobacterium sp. SWH-M3]|nr:hypothetical protein EB73_05700 [Mycobacterium sp. SWH-M3]
MTATADDYAWWSSWRPEWADSYCITVLSDAEPHQVAHSLETGPPVLLQGIDALLDRTVEHWGAGYDPDQAMLGVAGIDGGWSLIAESNGYVGVTERLIGPLSIDRTVVSHFRNINAVHRFQWWHDGRLLVDFDLLFPTERFGADPDVVLDDLRAIGIPLDAGPEDVAAIDLSAAGFALAERITGVACTAELFETSRYLAATVAMPGHEEQARYGEALRATWHVPTTW